MKKAVILFLHLGYWIIFLLLLAFIFTLLRPAINNTKPLAWNPVVFRNWMMVMSGFAVLPGIVSFYMFYTFLFNRFFIRRRVIAFLLGGVLTVLGTAVGGVFYMALLMRHLRYPFAGTLRAYIEVIVVIAFGALLNGIIGLVMKGFITSYGDIRVKEELNRKNFEVELALVKSQLSPHFLFNTINNIDVLIGIDAARASAYLNKLSDIMRFMLYETKTELIPLEEELAYIEKYIDLQKIRTANPDYIRFRVQGRAPGLLVPPMLFIPFIENAFKHGVKSGISHAFVKISLLIMDETLSMEITNSRPPAQETKGLAVKEAGGIGIRNVRRRLEILYPGRHRLRINQSKQEYAVHLNIEL